MRALGAHGRGTVTRPARYVLERTTGVVGFFGASSIERLPTKRAVTEQTRALKAPTTG
ncbi:phosphoenolpyruvate hydrolase family protein [Streptomyces flavochromogenes]|uniref:Phosphoenolpyruvate hydrolase family protein n=1 Tax=Streptomyces flavochromogenes TaxID=68199 RepID=A0ABW6XRP3_9ACTN